MVGLVISLIVAAGYIAVQWGKGVMIRNSQVRGDAVAAFLAYFSSVKIEVKKKDLYRQVYFTRRTESRTIKNKCFGEASPQI